MITRSWLLFGCAACSGSPAEPVRPAAHGEASTTVVASTPASVPSYAPSNAVDLDAPLTGAPRLVIANRTDADLSLYRGYLVDEEGKLGTVSLWPHPSDCPNDVAEARTLPRGGSYDLKVPETAYDGERCSPSAKLPPGRYHVRIESGYGEDLFAGGALTLPLTAPVRLDMINHSDPPACTPLRARRAARLALDEAHSEGVPDALVKSCDVSKARCGVLPLPEEELPEHCTLTLHEQLLRVRFPPRDGDPKELTAWFDHDIIIEDRPTLSRSTGAELRVADARVVLEGLTGEHRHEHGGRAATIGAMRVRVDNGSKRTLSIKALAVDWLTGNSCGTPEPNAKPPRVLGVEPASVPPGSTEIIVSFDARDAYQAWCDVFASRATLEIAGQTVRVVSEHHVTRIEPLRTRP